MFAPNKFIVLSLIAVSLQSAVRGGRPRSGRVSEFVQLAENSAALNYSTAVLSEDQLVNGTQLVKLHLEPTSQQRAAANQLESDRHKQSQDFDTGKPTPSTVAVNDDSQGNSTLGETTTPTSSSANTTTSTSATTEKVTVSSTTETSPVASKTAREGASVQCGEANASGQSERKLLTDRIVGGRKSEPGEFPYQVRLGIRSKRGSGICGGIVIDEHHILTAAHCMTSCISRGLTTATIASNEVVATIGDHAIRSPDGEQEVTIEHVTPHEKYDACNFYANDHDIALLRTVSAMKFRFTTDGYGSINRPCLPTNPNAIPAIKPQNETSIDTAMPVVRNETVYHEGELVIVSGWGVMRENSGALSNILRYVKLPMVNTSSCQDVYGTRVTDKHVCAGFQGGGKDSCQGDSGGPLVRVVDNKYELVGIVSFGYGCAQPGAFGVYTRVASYLDWIHGNL